MSPTYLPLTHPSPAGPTRGSILFRKRWIASELSLARVRTIEESMVGNPTCVSHRTHSEFPPTRAHSDARPSARKPNFQIAANAPFKCRTGRGTCSISEVHRALREGARHVRNYYCVEQIQGSGVSVGGTAVLSCRTKRTAGRSAARDVLLHRGQPVQFRIGTVADLPRR